MSVEVGAPAPDFVEAARDGGGVLSLSDFAGMALALYFYPKDNTKGCTTEAEDFNALSADFAAAGAAIIGVSKDPVRSHDNFVKKLGLGFPLISDSDGALCEAYGVWVEKSMYGRTYMGIERATFLIDRSGIVRQIWRKVRVKGHAQAVLDATQAL